MHAKIPSQLFVNAFLEMLVVERVHANIGKPGRWVATDQAHNVLSSSACLPTISGIDFPSGGTRDIDAGVVDLLQLRESSPLLEISGRREWLN